MTRPSSSLPSRAGDTCCVLACTARCSGRSPPAPSRRRACRSRRRSSPTASRPAPGRPCQITPPLSSTRIGTSGKCSLSASSRPFTVPRRRPSSAERRTISRWWRMSWVSSRSTPSQAASSSRMSGGAWLGSKWCGQPVEDGDDRVQELLERAHEAHAEIAILIQRRQPVAQIRARRGDRRRPLRARRHLDHQRAEARSAERLVAVAGAVGRAVAAVVAGAVAVARPVPCTAPAT